MEYSTPEFESEQLNQLWQRAIYLSAHNQPDSARYEYLHLLALDPNCWPAHFRLGLLLLEQGKAESAATHFHKVLEQAPEPCSEKNRAFCLLGQILLNARHLSEALIALKQALAGPTPDVYAHLYLGELWFEQERWAEARWHFEQFLAHHPQEQYMIWRLKTGQQLARIAQLTGQPLTHAPVNATESASLALENSLRLPLLFDSAAERQQGLQDWPIHLRARRADLPVIREPLWEIAQSDYYRLSEGPESARPLLELAGDLLRTALPETEIIPVFSNNDFRTPRLGLWCHFQQDYSSLMPLILELSKVYNLLLFCCGPVPEAVLCDATIQVISLPRDLALQRQEILRYELDMLFYSAIGPADPNALLLAQYRLAPVQAVLPGYPVTSGLHSLDYYLSADRLEPPGAEQDYTETLCRFEGLPWAPAVFLNRLLPASSFSLPAEQHTLLCPVQAQVLHPDFDTVLAELLRAAPRALVLVGAHHSSTVNQRLRARWEQHFPHEADRIQWLPPLSPFQRISLAAAVDLVLDPLYCGLQAEVLSILAAGTPVVSLPGAFQRSRMAHAAYQLLGLSEGLVDSPAGYVAQVLHWLEHPQERQAFAAQLRAGASQLNQQNAYFRSLHAFINQHLARSF